MPTACAAISMGPPSGSPRIGKGKRHFVTLAFITNAIDGRDFTIREDQFAACGRADAQFLFFLANFKTGCSFLYDNGCDSFFALRRVSIYVHDRGVCSAAIRSEE